MLIGRVYLFFDLGYNIFYRFSPSGGKAKVRTIIPIVVTIAIVYFILAIVLIIRKHIKGEKIKHKFLVFFFLFISFNLIGPFLIFLPYTHCEDICYDYLPDSSGTRTIDEVTVSTTKTGYFFDGPGTESAIVFYPGGKVDTKAYAPLMYKLAEGGKDCFLVDMPLHMAFLDIGAADYYIDNYEYENWYLMGHSLGGAVIPAYLYGTDNRVDGIILLAAYSTFKIKRYVPVITIYGTNDGVMNTKRFNDCISNWSYKTQEVVIRGGNHSQFGYYGLQKGDNKASISREEQQEITVEAIIEWTDNLEKNKAEK